MSNRSVHFLSIPNSASAIVHYAVNKQARENSVNSGGGEGPGAGADTANVYQLFDHSSGKVQLQNQPQNLIVFFVHPALRLLYAYEATKHRTGYQQSFARFYREKGRLNFYSRLFGDTPVSSLGFIGLSEHLHRSSLLLEKYLGLSQPLDLSGWNADFYKLDDDVIADIKEYHAQDFQLYEEVSRCFAKKWAAYQSERFEEMSSGSHASKKVTLHVGPPKTGTSAIQSWLLQNRDALAKEGVLYPCHGADNNDISSGNFREILSYDNQTASQLVDTQKLDTLLSEFYRSDYHQLLLSSEHFFYTLPSILQYIPGAEIIFYVRHPLLSFESIYHQGVKRHKRSTVLSPPNRWNFAGLERMISIARDFNVDVKYRYYCAPLYEGGTLVDDFCHACSLTSRSDGSDQRINSGYAFEALELMRIFNQFGSETSLRELDWWFQKHSAKSTKFTLLTRSEIDGAQQQLASQLERLSLLDPALDLQKLHTLIDDLPSPRTEVQGEFGVRFIPWLERLKNEKPDLLCALNKELHSAESSLEGRDFLVKHLKSGTPSLFAIIRQKLLNW